MGKACLLFAAFLLLSPVISAQTRQRYIDNFDLASGVKVHVPSQPAAKPVTSATAKKKADATVSKVKPIVMTRASVQAPSLLMSAGKSLGAFSTGDATIDRYIQTSSAKYDIDPLLIYAQMNQESSFKLKATSYKGARGLMQLMPATAARFGVTSIYDPQQNIEAGVRYMRWLLNTFGGDLRLALAGYNAGEGAVMKYGNQIPPYRETQDYVARITARYAQIKNPNFVPSVNRATETEHRQQIAQTTKNELPKPIYVPSAAVERLPDGRIRLVTQ